jgi:hypothetical protein
MRRVVEGRAEGQGSFVSSVFHKSCFEGGARGGRGPTVNSRAHCALG